MKVEIPAVIAATASAVLAAPEYPPAPTSFTSYWTECVTRGGKTYTIPGSWAVNGVPTTAPYFGAGGRGGNGGPDGGPGGPGGPGGLGGPGGYNGYGTVTGTQTISTCTEDTCSDKMLTTTWVTTYVNTCPTGLETKTTTMTESCPGPTPSWSMNSPGYVPSGWTKTSVTCTACGPTPVTTEVTCPASEITPPPGKLPAYPQASSPSSPSEAPEGSSPKKPEEAPKDESPKSPESPEEAPESPKEEAPGSPKSPEESPESPKEAPESPESPAKAPEAPEESPEESPKFPEEAPESPESPSKAPESPEESPEEAPGSPGSPKGGSCETCEGSWKAVATETKQKIAEATGYVSLAGNSTWKSPYTGSSGQLSPIKAAGTGMCAVFMVALWTFMH